MHNKENTTCSLKSSICNYQLNKKGRMRGFLDLSKVKVYCNLGHALLQHVASVLISGTSAFDYVMGITH